LRPHSPKKSGSADSKRSFKIVESTSVLKERINSAFAEQQRRNSAATPVSVKAEDDKGEEKL